MPDTIKDFLDQYSAGSSRESLVAFERALENRFDRSLDSDMTSASTYTMRMRENLWKYGENGILQKVDLEESDMETVMEDMLQGAVYVLPGINADGDPDMTKMHSMSATELDGKYYVHLMDAAEAKKAYENKPKNGPNFIDRLVDFFCKLFGKRDVVCALWDKASQFLVGAEQLTAQTDKIDFQKELIGGDYTRQEKELSQDESAARKQQAQEMATKKAANFDEALSEWYLALYANTHDLFPTFISDEAEIKMTQLDQEAKTFAGNKFTYSANDHYWRSADLEGAQKGFDVRVNTVTTLAFALTADQNLSAETVFDFLAGKNSAETEGLQEKMDEAIAMINNNATRNSSRVHDLIQKGTNRMCTLLENQEDLQSGISYQLGRVIQRNQVAFGPESNHTDVSIDLKVSPVAKQIVKLQDDIINSYNSNVLQGFARHPSEKEIHAGIALTETTAHLFLPTNAKGQTNTAFLGKLSQQPPKDRLQFLKSNLPVLEEMNENMGDFIAQKAREDGCSWLQSPEALQAALNGGMVKDYQAAVLQSLQKTGKLPTVENTMDRLMANDSFMMS